MGLDLHAPARLTAGALATAALAALAPAGCGGSAPSAVGSSASASTPAASAQSTATQGTATQGTAAQSTPRQSTAMQSTPTQSAQSAAPSPAAPRTPQQAVRAYFDGIHNADGAKLCAVLDSRMQRSLTAKLLQVRPTEAGDTCEQAMTNLAALLTSPGEQAVKLPAMHVTMTSRGAIVSYLGVNTHRPRTFTLLRRGHGWVIDGIGKG